VQESTSIRSKEVVMPVGREQDRDNPRDEQRVLEEIRRLFERYRETAHHADWAAEQHERLEEQRESHAVTSR
jgi:hypothetical protein